MDVPEFSRQQPPYRVPDGPLQQHPPRHPCEFRPELPLARRRALAEPPGTASLPLQRALQCAVRGVEPFRQHAGVLACERLGTPYLPGLPKCLADVFRGRTLCP